MVIEIAASLAMRCQALQEADLAHLMEAPSYVSATRVVRGNDIVPDHCEISGYVVPNVGFEMRLPLANWNGKFLEVGCGDDCGDFKWSFWCHLSRGYACIVSDMGHRGSGGLWASSNLQAQVDFGYRGAHVAALVGKAIIVQFYGRAPKHSYFWGCSTGGRQALVEAQRFPQDFDGILAGAPAIDDVSEMTNIVWASRALRTAGGKPIATRADLQVVHQAVLEACDQDDGVRDGLISNPAACRWDPKSLHCEASGSTGCLSPSQIEALNKVYGGPLNSKGEKLSAGGPALGSELRWVDDPSGYVSSDGRQTALESSALRFFRYIVNPPRGPAWELGGFDFDRDPERFSGGVQQSLMGASNPDLRKFEAVGGKLILYHGWSDPVIPPAGTVDYYETVRRTMGGSGRVSEFARLFMVPGMLHCGAGEGASEIDYLSALDSWVDSGKAPELLVGTHVDVDQIEFLTEHWQRADLMSELERFNQQPKRVLFSRPIFPFPAVAKYRGSGSSKDAANFAPAPP